MTNSVLTFIRRAGCLAAFGVLLLGPAASAGEAKQPVFVELFTSQGCSSCPQADVILGELQKREDVVALSFSIDYWDYVGWKDTLATRENTLRQQAYEKTLPSHRVYTPQMVIDGVRDVVGNQRRDVVDAINKRLAATQGKRLPISIMQKGDEIHVKIGAAPSGGHSGTVWLAHTLSSRTVNINKGENSGRVITYHNIVRGFSAVGKWSGQPVTLELPTQGVQGEITDGVAVWVQDGGNGVVFGAAQARVTNSD
jgi:hypothetical protein